MIWNMNIKKTIAPQVVKRHVKVRLSITSFRAMCHIIDNLAYFSPAESALGHTWCSLSLDNRGTDRRPQGSAAPPAAPRCSGTPAPCHSIAMSRPFPERQKRLSLPQNYTGK